MKRTRLALLLVFGMLAALLPMAAVPAGAATTDLLISEYIEGSSNNKAIEIYNGTGAAVDLATGGYNIQIYFNGSASTLTINLTGSVANGDVFVLAQAAANATILAQADQTNGAGWFNGDDAVVLRKGSTNLDVIGQIGFDPGSEWGSGLLSTQDNTLRRMATICAGDPDGSNAFDPSLEWEGFAVDTFDGLGAARHQLWRGRRARRSTNSRPARPARMSSTSRSSAPDTDLAAYKVLEIEGDSGAAPAQSTRSSASARRTPAASTWPTCPPTHWRTAR